MLYQFQQHAAGGARVQEGDARAARAGTRRCADGRQARLARPLQRRLDVGDAQRDVVQPLAPACQELAHRAVIIQGFKQLDGRLARAEVGGADAFAGNGLGVFQLQPQRLPARQPVGDGRDGEAEVVDGGHASSSSAG